MLSLLYQYLNESQANLIFCLVIAVPLSYLMSILRNKYLNLALSITVAYTIQNFIFPQQKYILWVQQAIVYLLLIVCPQKRVGVIIFFESFLYLSAVQARRMYISYGENSIDITGILMMQTFLYVSLGFNYQNGAKPD